MTRTPEDPPRVLITNRTLATRTGTELYVRDLAFALSRRGYSPMVYTPLLGDVAREIRAKTIPVTDNLLSIAEPPDLIHGHHAPETLAALLAFPETPAISFCHSWIGWADAPLRFPRVLRYVAVDHTCRDRLRFENGIGDERIEIVLNSVDLDRFRPRPPLPRKPSRALVFSNAARPGAGHLKAIQAACESAGIAVEVAGSSSGKALERPEETLGQFDLVFAKAKAALEAMSVGTAVILCDSAGAGPLVTTGNLAELRPLNFGMRTLGHPLEARYLAEQIARYDAGDATAVSETIRQTAGTESMIDQLCRIYSEVLAEHALRVRDAQAEGRAAAEYLQSLAPRLLHRDALASAFGSLLKKPLLGSLARRAAKSPRRSWLAELIRLQELD